MIYAEFSPLFTVANCAYILSTALSSGEIKLRKFQWRHLRIPDVLSKKFLKPDWCRNDSSIHWRKLRINIAYSSGDIRHWNFNDVIRAYRKYFRKSSWSLIDACIISLFTGENCALILLIVAEISDIEIFNDVIHSYRKYFRKSCLQTKCVEMDSVLSATNNSSISLTVLRLFAFKGIYDVIFVNRK